MDDASQELATLAGPSAGQGWRDLGMAASAQMPPDYVNLVRQLGAGCFNGFLWLLVPGCPNQYLDLDRQTVELGRMLEECVEQGEDVPPIPNPHASQLTPWAVSDNGDIVWWYADESDSRVLVSAVRPLEWEAFDLSCTSFLVQFVTAELPTEILMSDMGPVGFAPWQPAEP